MRKNSSQSPFEKVTILLFFLGIVFSVTHKLWAYDVWWHLKTGEWIFKYHQVPVTNLYSYTAADHPWIDLSWFFQLLMYLSYSFLGINGIILFKTAVVIGSFFVLFYFFYKKTDLLVLIPTLILTLFTVHERLVERPEILSYFFLLSSFSLLESDRAKQTKKLYFLPLIQILWANSHSLFVLGLFVVSLESTSQVLSWFLSRKDHPFPKRIVLVTFLSFLSSLATPYGFKGFLFPFRLFTRISGEKEFFTSEIGEFKRPLGIHDSTSTVALFEFLILLTSFSFLRNRKNFRKSSFFLFIAFGALALLARRNIAPFSFTAVFLLLSNLQGIQVRFPSRQMRSLASAFLFCTVLALPIPFVTNGYYRHERSGKIFGFGITESRYPVEVARFVEKTDLPGNSFTSGFEIGDYFIWYFYPRRHIFIDGRLEAYPDFFFKELFQLLHHPYHWPEWVEKYRINFCILNHTNPKNAPLLIWLYHSSEWQPVYVDNKTVLFLKNSPENRQILNTYRIDLAKDPIPPVSEGPEAELQLADFYGKIGIFDKAELLYKKDMPHFSRRGEFHNNFGNILSGEGKYEKALLQYRKAISLQPKNYFFHYNLGRFYLARGQYELALQVLKESSRLSPPFGEAHLLLGKCYVATGQFDKAEMELSSIHASDAAYLPGRNELGILYARRGELEKAEREFRAALESDPSYTPAQENLKRLDRMTQK